MLSFAKLFVSSPVDIHSLPEYLNVLENASSSNDAIREALRKVAELADRGENERWNIADQNGIAIILQVMKNFAAQDDDGTLQYYAAQALSGLSIEKGMFRRREIVRYDGIACLMEALRIHHSKDDKQVVLPVCEAVKHLSHKNLEIRKVIVDSGCIPLLIQVMLRHVEDAALYHAAGQALIALVTTVDPTHHQPFPERIILANARGIQAYLKGFQKHPHDRNVVMQSLLAIRILSFATQYRLVVMDGGGISSILQAMRYYRPWRKGSPVIQQAACLALRALSEDVQQVTVTRRATDGSSATTERYVTGKPEDVQAIRKTIIYNDGIETLVQTVKEFKNSTVYDTGTPGIHEAAILALQPLLCYRKSETEKANDLCRFEKAGGFPVLVSLLRCNPPLFPSKAACRILLVAMIGPGTARSRDMVVDAGGIKAVVSLMYHNIIDGEIIVILCKMLAKMVENHSAAKLLWIQAGGIKPFLSAAKRHAKNEGVQVAVCLAYIFLLKSTAKDLTVAKALVDGMEERHGLIALLRTLRNHPTSRQVAYVAVYGLSLALCCVFETKATVTLCNIINAGAFMDVFQAMQRFVKDEAIQCYACGALGMLASERVAAHYGTDQMGEVFTVIGSAMKEHRSSARLQSLGCRTIARLATLSRCASTREALDAVEKAKVLYPCDKEVQMLAERALLEIHHGTLSAKQNLHGREKGDKPDDAVAIALEQEATEGQAEIPIAEAILLPDNDDNNMTFAHVENIHPAEGVVAVVAWEEYLGTIEPMVLDNLLENGNDETKG